ncbi:MAG: type IV pilus assembly protein PilM [Candidatus Spechtbacterales bacterium]|nr:type IV pilus assembly protein PilM [Candidatus Spechtbacterales bacterium]
MGLNSLKNRTHIIPPAFGLDISDTSFKAMQLVPKGKYYRVAAFGEADIGDGIVEEGKIIQPDKLRDILKKELVKYKNLSRYVVASLPDEEVYLKTLKIPHLQGKELKNAVRVEAERNMPIQADETYFDYAISEMHEDTDHLHAHVAATKKEIVDVYIDTLSSAGFIPAIIEPEVTAIARSALTDGRADKGMIVIEIGANRTRLIAVIKESIALTGSVNFSAKEASEKIAEALGVSPEKAGKIRWEERMLEDPKYGSKIEQGLAPAYDRIAEAIHSYMGFLNEHLKEEGGSVKNIEKLIVSGGGARLPGIAKQLSMLIQKPVERVNPWINVLPQPLNEIPELDYADSIRYTTSIGLALRGASDNLID